MQKFKDKMVASEESKKIKKGDLALLDRANKLGTPVVPVFWKEVLRFAPRCCDLIEKHDEEVLQYLEDISIDEESVTCARPDASFSVHFHFRENEFFENKVLTKRMEVRSGREVGVIGPKWA